MIRFFRQAILILLVLAVLFAGGTVALAREDPFRPGDALFPLQHFAEQASLLLQVDKTSRAK